MTPFERHVQHIEQTLDGVVDHGTDDELFIASYLQGHVAVIAKPMEVDDTATLELLDKAVKKSLSAAFANKELDAADQGKVVSLWQRIVDQQQTGG